MNILFSTKKKLMLIFVSIIALCGFIYSLLLLTTKDQDTDVNGTEIIWTCSASLSNNTYVGADGSTYYACWWGGDSYYTRIYGNVWFERGSGYDSGDTQYDDIYLHDEQTSDSGRMRIRHWRHVTIAMQPKVTFSVRENGRDFAKYWLFSGTGTHYGGYYSHNSYSIHNYSGGPYTISARPDYWSVYFYSDDVSQGHTTVTNFNYYKLISISKTGYTFLGWYTAKNGGTQITTSSWFQRTSSIDLYAHWTPNYYTINYAPGEGESGSVSSQGCYYDASYNLRQNGYSKKGYHFTGWKCGNTIYSAGQSVSNLTSEPNGSVTMTAQWAPNTYTVSYSANGGSGSTASQSIKYDSNFYLKDSTGFSREGHYFTSWNERSDGQGTSWNGWINRAWPYTYDYDITLYAQWAKENYTYNFYTERSGGTIKSTAGVTYGQTFASFPTLYKNGYTHVGWQINNSGTTYSGSMKVFDHGGNGASVNFYPVWSANTIHISLSPSPGSGGTREFWYKYNTNTFYSNSGCTSRISSISIPTYRGYRFDDYHGNGSSGGGNGERYIWGDGTFAGDLYCDIYKDATLYPTWTAKTYTLSFHYNLPGQGVQSTKTVTFDKPYGTLPIASTGKHIFLGWFTSSSGGTEVTSSMTYTTDGDQTLYAHWEETWACHTTAPSGSGTANSPYLIDSANKLAWVIENFGSGKTYKQTTDIDMSSYTWLPIGTTNNPFSGNYIGDGNKIFNLKTSKKISNIRDGREDNVGLFGVVDNAYIETVIMRGADITGRNNVGGFVGYAKGKLTIDSSIFDGKVIATSNYGGFIGSSANGSAIIKSSVSKLNSSSSTSAESLLRGQTAVCQNSIGINQSGNLYTTGDYNASSWAIIDGMTYPLPNKLSWIANGQ